MAKTSSSAKNTPPKTKKTTKQSTKRLKLNLLPRQYIGLALIAVMAIGLSWLVLNKVGQPNTHNTKLQVTATFYPLAYFAQQVGGSLVDVTNLTPAGTDAHDFEPTPSDLTRAYAAQVFIYNSASMEPWVNKFLADYHHTAIEASQAASEHHQEHEEAEEDHQDHDHHDHANDPHTWTDPIMAQEIIESITKALIKADPQHQSTYHQNSQSLLAKLKQLDQDFQAGLAQCQQRTIITSHAAFSYFAERYDIEVLSISGLSPEQEPSAAKLAELKQLVKQKNIGYIFFEHAASPQLAQTLASETGAKLAILDPIESLSQSALDQGQDYLSIQRSNLAHLRTALACR